MTCSDELGLSRCCDDSSINPRHVHRLRFFLLRFFFCPFLEIRLEKAGDIRYPGRSMLTRWPALLTTAHWWSCSRHALLFIRPLIFHDRGNFLVQSRTTFYCSQHIPPDHLLLDSAPNLGPLISRGENDKFENCWYKSVRILEILKLLFQQFLNLSSSQRDIRGTVQ